MAEQPPVALTAPSRTALWTEFLALFVGAPLAIAVFLEPERLFAALFGFTLVGLGLIWWTGEFRWSELVTGWARVRWGRTLAFAVLVGATGWLVMIVTHPGFVPDFSPQRLRFLPLLWLLYPFFSALPQELIFRVLFFHRYAPLFPSMRAARLTNAGIFALAHLMYWSSVVAVMTFVGGWIFADVYLKRGFPAAWVLHAIAGNVLFTVGMGAYFWSGNVVRPF
ncbi:CPBP family intramembrane glutamic endopeptidase [uncultured Paracoccus sp.]|uniref:CPBP family intramembrane glutamic endopeptidase n=1 Tax=uncultured Paracoccus sp. TaxID=189685 RepID=UPI0026305979|nr:CPBP family intramembrane glutamic endopeptidase [uncultured Paracoccus sp.]